MRDSYKRESGIFDARQAPRPLAHLQWVIHPLPMNHEAVASEAVVVQAAVAEIARLQVREGYACLKP